MNRSELEVRIANITGAELKNGRWMLAGRDFSLAMDGLVTEMERKVADAIEPIVDVYNTKNPYDNARKLHLKTEWSRMSRALMELTKLYKELS
jgi:hypothetical protein